jgi:integrase
VVLAVGRALGEGAPEPTHRQDPSAQPARGAPRRHVLSDPHVRPATERGHHATHPRDAEARPQHGLQSPGEARGFAEPKTHRGASTISLDAETVAVLRTYRAGQAAERLAWGSAYESQDLVFCKQDGSPVSPELVSRRFIALGAEAGLSRIVLHGLRHPYATNAPASGEEVVTVSERLGHSRSHVTADNYMRLTEAADRQAAERMAARVREAGQRRLTGEVL